MKRYYFMSVALMAILVTSMGGLQQASALMGTNAHPPGANIDFYELLDGSGSVSAADFLLEKQGTVSAFNAAISPADYGKLRITVIQFSNGAAVECQQSINSAADVATLNACILAIVQVQGLTCMACAFNLVAAELAISPINGPNDRSIVDLVTDGFPNSQANTVAAVNAAIGAGLDSNVALAVGAGASTAFLSTITHPAPPGPINPAPFPDPLVQGFVATAANFAAFEAVMLEKFATVAPPVGGELLSIDNAALLVAGAQTNAVWIMSALAVIGSVAFGALYLNTKKN